MNNEDKELLRLLVKRYKYLHTHKEEVIEHIVRCGFNKQTVKKYWRALNEKSD